jgi:hypothetical protein
MPIASSEPSGQGRPFEFTSILPGPDRTVVRGAQKGGIGKVAYLTVGSEIAARTARGVHEAIKSDHAPISPARP